MAASVAIALTGANADLLVAIHYDVCTNALLALGAVESDLVSADSAFNCHNAACLALLAGFNVFLYEVSALNDNLFLLDGNLEDFADRYFR